MLIAGFRRLLRRAAADSAHTGDRLERRYLQPAEHRSLRVLKLIAVARPPGLLFERAAHPDALTAQPPNRLALFASQFELPGTYPWAVHTGGFRGRGVRLTRCRLTGCRLTRCRRLVNRPQQHAIALLVVGSDAAQVADV